MRIRSFPALSKPNNPYKNSSGVYLTKALFFETSVDPDKAQVVYTLKQEDHPIGYPSLRRLYLETEDPTEYKFAQLHLGGWDHWKKFKDTDWFKEFLGEWREELELRLKSKAYKCIMDEANDVSSKNRLAANKFVIETVRRIQQNKDLGERTENPRGRPSASDISAEAVRIAEEQKRIEEEEARILN
jgi:hypothetical protein